MSDEHAADTESQDDPITPSTADSPGAALNGETFFAALFDFSFSTFITTKIIKALYIVAIAFSLLGGLMMIIGGFSNGFLSGVVTLALAPVVVLIYIVMARVWLELVIVLFNISEDIRSIADKT